MKKKKEIKVFVNKLFVLLKAAPKIDTCWDDYLIKLVKLTDKEIDRLNEKTLMLERN